MRSIFSLILIATLHIPASLTAQQKAPDWLFNWINAWELVNKDLLKQPATDPPFMLFYDNDYIYTNSSISAPNGQPISGPAIYGSNITWLKAPHKDSITLPNGETVAVQLMSFAATTGNNKSFFVMAAPAFWENAGVKSTHFTLDLMLTGVFLHEFTHCRQYSGFGRMVDSIEKQHSFKEVPLSDDIVQGYFKSDSAYVKLWTAETSLFYSSAFIPEKKFSREMAGTALDLLQLRQRKYFSGDKAILKKLDNIFLSMEGLGQYVAVYWLSHPIGGMLLTRTAVEGFRRKRNQWSQEEGLGIFLALSRLSKNNWIDQQFSANPTDAITLLEETLKKKH